MADHPAIRCVHSDELPLDVFTLDQRFVSALDQVAQMVIDVMFVMPFAPRQVPIGQQLRPRAEG